MKRYGQSRKKRANNKIQDHDFLSFVENNKRSKCRGKAFDMMSFIKNKSCGPGISAVYVQDFYINHAAIKVEELQYVEIIISPQHKTIRENEQIKEKLLIIFSLSSINTPLFYCRVIIVRK